MMRPMGTVTTCSLACSRTCVPTTYSPPTTHTHTSCPPRTGQEHCIANMFVVPLGIALGAPVSFGQFLVANLVPVTLGNIVGGFVFVAMGTWSPCARSACACGPAPRKPAIHCMLPSCPHPQPTLTSMAAWASRQQRETFFLPRGLLHARMRRN